MSTNDVLLARLCALLLEEPPQPDPDELQGAALEEVGAIHYGWYRQVAALRLLLGVRLVNDALDQRLTPGLRETAENRIRRFRVRAGIGQAQLARSLGISPSYLAHIEAGRRRPSPELVQKVALALDVKAEELSDD